MNIIKINLTQLVAVLIIVSGLSLLAPLLINSAITAFGLKTIEPSTDFTEKGIAFELSSSDTLQEQEKTPNNRFQQILRENQDRKVIIAPFVFSFF